MGGTGLGCIVELERCPKMSSNAALEPISDRRYAKAKLVRVKLFPRTEFMIVRLFLYT